MNPLIVFFFISMILEDYLFKQGGLLKYMIYSLLLYWIFYMFVEKTTYHSISRKLLLASYSQSYDPSVYVKFNLETQKAKEFLSRLKEKSGKNISITLLFTKVCAETFKKYREFNQSLKFGSIHDKGNIDICLLVNIGGKDLANVTLRNVANKTFNQLSDELYPKTKNLREGKDQEFNKTTGMMRNIPTFIIGLMLEVVGYLSNIGITIKPLGIEKNKFGSVIITSVTNFKLSNAYAPLCPFTHTSCILTVCSTKIKKTLNKDGTITEKEVLPINIVSDHRFIDGAAGAKMIKECRRLFENPEEMEIY